MPKRGSSTSISSTAVPRKKQKSTQSTNGHNDEEQDENTPLNHSTYSSQLFKKSPDVNLNLVLNYRQILFF
jgi:hypothetical protein